jgi:CheY-like chemotaxis protein
MTKADRGVLDLLKGELDFIKSGGYGNLERATGKRPLIFRDSPSCLHSSEAQRNSPCYECPLMEFVPPAARSRNLPCHAVPAGPDGETVAQAAAQHDRQYVEQMVAQWLKSTIRRIEQAQRLATASRTAQLAERSRTPQVLIVDDDEGLPIVLAHLLEHGGYDTTTAPSGHAALRDLARRSFDLILLDDYLPDISTEVVLRHAGSLEPSVPVLLMQSGPLPHELALKYARLGVRFFISKHSPKEVAGLVDDCLDGSKLVAAES